MGKSAILVRGSMAGNRQPWMDPQRGVFFRFFFCGESLKWPTTHTPAINITPFFFLRRQNSLQNVLRQDQGSWGYDVGGGGRCWQQQAYFCCQGCLSHLEGSGAAGAAGLAVEGKWRFFLLVFSVFSFSQRFSRRLIRSAMYGHIVRFFFCWRLPLFSIFSFFFSWLLIRSAVYTVYDLLRFGFHSPSARCRRFRFFFQ